jgi:hypothetical protein
MSEQSDDLKNIVAVLCDYGLFVGEARGNDVPITLLYSSVIMNKHKTSYGYIILNPVTQYIEMMRLFFPGTHKTYPDKYGHRKMPIGNITIQNYGIKIDLTKKMLLDSGLFSSCFEVVSDDATPTEGQQPDQQQPQTQSANSADRPR